MRTYRLVLPRYKTWRCSANGRPPARFFGAPTPHGLQSTAAMLLLKERVLEADTERFEVQRRMGSGSCTWHPRCPSAFHATPMFVTACVCFHLQTARSGKEPIDAEVTR